MSSWTIADSAAGAPLWAVTTLNKAPSTANRTSLYENTTADTFISGATHGLSVDGFLEVALPARTASLVRVASHGTGAAEWHPVGQRNGCSASRAGLPPAGFGPGAHE